MSDVTHGRPRGRASPLDAASTESPMPPRSGSTMRLDERAARTLLLVRAVEETDRDGVLLGLDRRAAATRQALASAAPEDDGALLRRADMLRDEILRRTPGLARLLEPPRLRRAIVPLIAAVAAAAGAYSHVLGADRMVSVLAFPLAGILAWNLLVYVGLVAGAVASRAAPGRRPGAVLAWAARWLDGATPALAGWLGRGAATVPAAVERFHALWMAAAARLIAARARAVMHLAALALACGAIAGTYASGIAVDYRATWESTWLDAPAVQRYVNAVLGPAAWALGIAVPDVASLREPGGGRGAAAPWIHLWAATLALFVVAPRAALALAAAGRAARARTRLALDLDASYYWHLRTGTRGAAVTVWIAYYSCDPDAARRQALHASLQNLAGARASILDGARLDYGDEPDALPSADEPGSSQFVVLVFPLAQSPELEVHGAFLERVQQRLAPGARLLVVLDAATYAARVGSEARARERWATWERLLRELHLGAVDLDDGLPTTGAAAGDGWLSRARQATWTRPAP